MSAPILSQWAILLPAEARARLAVMAAEFDAAPSPVAWALDATGWTIEQLASASGVSRASLYRYKGGSWPMTHGSRNAILWAIAIEAP